MSLENNADTKFATFVDDKDYTPLSYAMSRNHPDLDRLLIESGADTHRACTRGKTALWKAADLNHEAIVRLLIEKGADVNGCNSAGESTLSAARRQQFTGIARLLVENRASESQYSRITLLYCPSR
jgi:ankyrin repeat protein